MKSFTAFRRTVSCIALASAATLAGCQKEEFLEEPFVTDVSPPANSNGQAIAGQYIVVFNNGNSNLSAIGVGEMTASGRASAVRLRERTLKVAGLDAADLEQTFEGAVNGFAARLSELQLAKLRNNPEVAYVEQDKVLSIGIWKVLNKWDGNKAPATGNTTNTPAQPAPASPAPASPAPTAPPPAAPAPPAAAEPATDPAPTVPAAPYAMLTPAAGELVPWHIERVGYGDGTGKTVWIIDSGIDTDHPDLNIDLSRSKSFIYNVASVEDGFGHGTSVAGVVAARNNGKGMIGVAANATVVALRVFDDAGTGSLSRAISAVNHVVNYAQPGDVVNMSLGSGTSITLDNAIKKAAAKGVLFAIAAGNSAVDCAGSSPARLDAEGVYTISAHDSYNRLWDKSNYGLSVDFSAPGVNVTVTTKNGSTGGGAYGTSFAAPHVAGILLLTGKVATQGAITGDKDSKPDPVASLQ